MSWLAEHCPRLFRAREGRAARLAEESRVRIAAAQRLLDLRRLVAHRELQLIRAQASGNGRYIRERQAKLKRAQQSLVSLERRVRA